MSLGERKRNGIFEGDQEENKKKSTKTSPLDSRFSIEPLQNTSPHSENDEINEKENKEEQTGWNPKRKTITSPPKVVEDEENPEESEDLDEEYQKELAKLRKQYQKKPQDPRFAQELAPQKLPPSLENFDDLDEEFSTKKSRKEESDDWGTPPRYGVTDPEQLQKEEPKRGKKQSKTDENLSLRGESPRLGRKHDLFFQGSEPQEFRDVLSQVQEYISVNYSQLITENPEDSKEQMLRYISKYIQDKKVCVEGRTTEQLMDELYMEMAEYGFLTKYIFGSGVEEIDINAWNDIEIQYSGGKTEKLPEHFDSPDHAINVIRRMLQSAGIVLDNSQPVVLGHLSKNIRIAVMKTPIVDEDVGVSASIRIVNPQSMEKMDFVRGGTATEKMLDFLSVCIRYGVSICVAGATSSGKTTVLGWLLTTIPYFKRVYTIESGSRELDLVRTDEEGKVVNSVIHTLTRDSDNDKQKVDQIALLDVALRFNPDIVVVGEMRGPEANASQEAARTGVAVLTTIHANSARATYTRMISLCKRAVDMGDETLYQYVTEAYPIVVFCKQLENGSRRMMEILECVIEKDGNRVYRTLFQYIITENRLENGKFIIEGEHKQVNSVSQPLAKRFLEKVMPKKIKWK